MLISDWSSDVCSSDLMDLRQIRFFVAACEEGSLSAAANRLNCTASGVSQQMSALEARLGIDLLERTRRGVSPTAAGRRFYDRSLAIRSERRRVGNEGYRKVRTERLPYNLQKKT